MRRANRSSIIPVIAIVIGFILIISAAYVYFVSDNIFSPTTATPPSSSQDVPRISPEEAKNALDNGEAIFVDVRDFESYTEGHIPGALSIPFSEIQTHLDELPKDKLIIPY